MQISCEEIRCREGKIKVGKMEKLRMMGKMRGWGGEKVSPQKPGNTCEYTVFVLKFQDNCRKVVALIIV